MSQTKKKCDSLVLSRSGLLIVWRCHDIPRVHCYYFCLEPMARKDASMRTTSVTAMAFFFESSIFKVTWSQLCSKFLPDNYDRIENIILKDTLQLNMFQTWINLRTTSFFKTPVNMKEKWMTVPRKRSALQKSKRALRRTLNLSRLRFTYFIRFFFSQT